MHITITPLILKVNVFHTNIPAGTIVVVSPDQNPDMLWTLHESVPNLCSDSLER